MRTWTALAAQLAAWCFALLYIAGNGTAAATPVLQRVLAANASLLNSPSAVLLALFFIFAPTWAVFISRSEKTAGRLIFAAALLWCAALAARLAGMLQFSPFAVWFLYASLMLLAGLGVIIVRIMRAKENLPL